MGQLYIAMLIAMDMKTLSVNALRQCIQISHAAIITMG